MKSYQEITSELFAMKRFGINLGLEGISELLEKLGTPQNTLKAIHVAGTNGKGSTCALIESVAQAAGKKVGVYTSPHLVDFRERMRVHGEKISEKRCIELYEEVQPHITNQTFFEVTTAMAFLYFSQEELDLAIIEVGLGGRLDATNVITPVLSIITSIDSDHKKYLGDTLDKIAYEKAGIIKQGVPVIIPKNIQGKEVIEQVAKEKNSVVKLVAPSTQNSSLKGSFQQNNIALATQAIKEVFGKNISQEIITKGLLSTYWPGRFDFVDRNILVDCAHNAAAVKLLIKDIRGIKDAEDFERIIIMTGVMKDKDFNEMISLFEQIADEFVLVKVNIERASETKELAKYIKDTPYTEYGSIIKAVEETKKKLQEKDLLVISGSIFTVGEALSALGIEPFNS